MKWLKHYSAAHDNDKLSAILEQFGPEGYGIYWLLLEHFAVLLEKSDVVCPPISRSDLRWAQICHCSVRKFRKVAQTLAELKLIESNSAAELVQFSSRTKADRTQIVIPKLLKYRDEYQGKSGHSQDSKVDKDTEKIQSKEEETTTSPTPPSSGVADSLTKPKKVKHGPTPEQAEWFRVFWQHYWRKDARKLAEESFCRRVETVEQFQAVMSGLARQQKWMNSKEPGYRPQATTWLNQERWKDEPPNESLIALSQKTNGYQPFDKRAATRAEFDRLMAKEANERGMFHQ